jgi:hypothetical protein
MLPMQNPFLLYCTTVGTGLLVVVVVVLEVDMTHLLQPLGMMHESSPFLP